MHNKRIESDWNSTDVTKILNISLGNRIKNSIDLARLVALIKILTINPSYEEKERCRKINKNLMVHNITDILFNLYPIRKTIKYNKEKIWGYDTEEVIIIFFKEKHKEIESFKKNLSRINSKGKKENIELISRAFFEVTDELEDRITNKILFKMSIEDLVLKFDMITECIQDPCSGKIQPLKSEMKNIHSNISQNQWDDFEKDIKVSVKDMVDMWELP